MEVACGQCLGCRLDRSRMWAMRIVHESSLYELDGGNSFITLTYRDAVECTKEQFEGGFYIPDDWSLHKEHFRDFIKRLRKFFDPQKIRFFHCGEYGNRCKHGIDLETVGCPLCSVGRPHYHGALFNVDFGDLEPYAERDGEVRYTSKTLEKIWKYGFVDVGELNFDSAAYIARYIMKKITGVNADDHYMQCDIDGVATWVEPEYITMSTGSRCANCKELGYSLPGCTECEGGIGKRWYEKYKDDVFPSDEVPVPGSGVFKKVPRYYEEIFKCEDPLSLEQIKAVRLQFKKENEKEFSPERLMDKYKVKKAQVSMLKRSL